MNLPQSMEVVCCWPGNGDVYMSLGPTNDLGALARVYDYTPAAAERYLQGER